MVRRNDEERGEEEKKPMLPLPTPEREESEQIQVVTSEQLVNFKLDKILAILDKYA